MIKGVDLFIALAGLATALAAVLELSRRAVRAVKRWIVAQVADPIAVIRAEFSPDGGASMRDLVETIDARVTGLAQELERHHHDPAAHTGRRAADRRRTQGSTP